MAKDAFMWECECGYTDFGQYPPEECPDCQGLDSFLKVPDDQVEERQAEKVLKVTKEEEEEEDED